MSSSHRQGPLMNFLSLSPVTSSSFPKAQQAKPAAEVQQQQQQHKRRTSSMSSDGKSPTGFKVLKVAPVHFGEHGGDHQDDWHEFAVGE